MSGGYIMPVRDKALPGLTTGQKMRAWTMGKNGVSVEAIARAVGSTPGEVSRFLHFVKVRPVHEQAAARNRWLSNAARPQEGAPS